MKLEMNRLQLKWRIFLFLLGFCGLLLVILWLFQTVFLDSFYRIIKVTEIKNNAAIIAKNIDNENLSSLISGLSQNSDTSIEIMNLIGQTLYQTDDRKNSDLDHLPIQEKISLIMKAEEEDGEYYNYLSKSPPAFPDSSKGFVGNIPGNHRPPDQSLILVKIVNDVSGQPMVIILNAMISPVNATVTTIQYQLYFITGIMIILAVILAFIIAKRVSKPIEDINQSAKILAKGNYNTHFDGRGFREISELSTTLNTAAAELSKVESLRRELMANISHDLRTPLSYIYSYAEMMHDFPDEITSEQTQLIMDETKRLATLVNDVLDLSKIESGIQKTNLSEFNLTENIMATTQRMAGLVKNQGFHLSFLYEGEVTVRSDETKITQVFYNLLINAINYTGKDNTITIRQTVAEGKVKIEVADSGEGIAAEDLTYIWDRYYKVDKNHKRAITGTGLGLYIVKQVMQLLGGEYGVESQVGQGSTFWFELKVG